MDCKMQRNHIFNINKMFKECRHKMGLERFITFHNNDEKHCLEQREKRDSNIHALEKKLIEDVDTYLNLIISYPNIFMAEDDWER